MEKKHPPSCNFRHFNDIYFTVKKAQTSLNCGLCNIYNIAMQLFINTGPGLCAKYAIRNIFIFVHFGLLKVAKSQAQRM